MDFSRFESELTELARRRSTVAVVEIALVLTLAYFAASLLWTIGAGPAIAGSERMNPIDAAGTARAAPSYGILSSFDPFHRAEMSGAGVSPGAEAPPETALDIKLFGIRLASQAGSGTAIIRLENYRHSVLSVGDEISPGITLSEIHATYVILSRDGRRETLYLDPETPRDRGQSGVVARAAGQAVPAAARTNSAATWAIEGISFARELDDTGTVYGFTVRFADDAEIPAAFPLEAGDIVLAADGIPASDFSALARFSQTVLASTSATLLIERDGEQRTVQLGNP